ncbi:hypothetical protein TeGR_g13638 [Tetraparma gracilis]|uniref:Acetylxylan esterase n=1 Tax=Tetraparma gracilis TaxID=2962635 RepID=A0ABQ6N214_9STRA|nr:hypothetical protein TeGR_g13638 [Tetraparma gracilis]
MRAALCCFLLPPLLAASPPFRVIGRSCGSSDSSGYVSIGWPLSGIGFEISAGGEPAEFTVNISLPPIEWYDAKGLLEDGVRLGVFVGSDKVAEVLVTPRDASPARAFAVPASPGGAPSRVRVLRLSEDLYAGGGGNAVRIGGLSSERALGPLPPVPKVLFVGDSDTAGFGIHSHPYDPACLNPYNLWSSVGDASLSWAAQLAGLMGVEPTVTAVSGVGIEEAYGNKPWAAYRDGACPFDAEEWDYDAEMAPEKVVILLGPNDCGKSNGNVCPDGWAEQYAETLQHYADAYGPGSGELFSVVGGSSSGWNPALVEALGNATDAYNAGVGEGGKRARVIELSKDVWDEINDHANGFNGCFGHYNEKGHAKVAQDLIGQF